MRRTAALEMRQQDEAIGTGRRGGGGLIKRLEITGGRLAGREELIEPAINSPRGQNRRFDDVSTRHRRNIAGKTHRRVDDRALGMTDQEGAGAGVGDGAFSGKKPQPECGALLVAARRDDRQPTRKARQRSHFCRQATDNTARRDEIAQHASFDAEQLQQLVIPFALFQIEEVGTAAKGVIGDKTSAQVIDHPVLDADHFVRFLPDIRALPAQPAHLDGRENRRNLEPGTAKHQAVAVFHFPGQIGGAAILPHDRRKQRLCVSIQCNHRRALRSHRNTLRQHRFRGGSVMAAFQHGAEGGRPDSRILLNPPVVEGLRHGLALMNVQNVPIRVEQHGTHAGGADIDGNNALFFDHFDRSAFEIHTN